MGGRDVEQGQCRTLEEPVSLAVNRGVANPMGWALNVLRGRERRAARLRASVRHLRGRPVP